MPKNVFSAESFEYFGHHQYLALEDHAIRLGKTPAQPINEYRSGEKVVFTGAVSKDIKAEVSIGFQGDAQARDAGILFRTSGASIGYDGQRGYFAGLIPRTQLVILGRTDGSNWQELARAKTAIEAGHPQQLGIQVRGDRITVWHNGSQKIQHTDATYDRGSIGLRVVNTDATFSEIHVTQLMLLRRVRPFAANEVFQKDAHSPQSSSCLLDVALACRSDALLPVLYHGCRVLNQRG